MCLFYLVFGIDEAVVDELLVVAVLTDAIDCRSSIQVLGRGHLMMMMMMMMVMMAMMVMLTMMVLMVMMVDDGDDFDDGDDDDIKGDN